MAFACTVSFVYFFLLPTTMQNGTRLAAIDLGSNSFRLEIGKFEGGQIERVEYLKETVRQGAGLDEDNVLSVDAMERGWSCLQRFRERLAGFCKENIRAVGTQTLRQAVNRDEFLEHGRQILGVPIDVVSGREEARLIYQGAASLLPRSSERRLVVDIGGRSTELIIGKNLHAHTLESFQTGSVTWSMRYFPKGEFTPSAVRKAVVAAKAELDEALEAYGTDHWDVAYGCSGTVAAVSDLLCAAGGPPGVVTREGLDWLVKRMLQARNAAALNLVGLRDDRRSVIGGGVSVLRALFDLLEIKEMHVSVGALRQGVLHDLLRRQQPATDIRSQTVTKLMEKFSTDSGQATRVERTALALYRQLPHLDSQLQERRERKLRWAARLHEIGTHISHSNYHRHGAYILDNAEAPGFALSELHHLSQLVLGHRGKLHKLDIDWVEGTFASALLALRLAVIFCHARRNPRIAGISLQPAKKAGPAGKGGFVLTVPADWAASFPQSHYLLEQEVLAWSRTRIAFKLVVQ